MMSHQKNYTYSLYHGDTCIFEAEKSAWKIRNVAIKLKEKPGRKISIYRDQKLMPGGAKGLDLFLYYYWLQEHNK